MFAQDELRFMNGHRAPNRLDIHEAGINARGSQRGSDLTPRVGHFKTEALRFVSLFGFLAAKVR